MNMTLTQLDEAMMRDIQLHEEIKIEYAVDGWVALYSTDEGNTHEIFEADTPIQALMACFSTIRNKRGRRA